MANDIWYSIKRNRIQKGSLKGFTLTGENELVYSQQEAENSLFLPPLDGVEEGSFWGRLTMELTCSEENVCYLHVAASDSEEYRELFTDPGVRTGEKTDLIKKLGGRRFVNTQDVLLYDLAGRYLYIGIEVLGFGEVSIKNIRVGARGDNFMNMFPQVYQERNSFFHRYLSVFSSIYNDISDGREKLHEMLDLDKCSKDLLVMYASWFGIDVSGGFLPEDILRTFVKEAYHLNRIKGTKKALLRILQIFLGEDSVLLENRLQDGGIYEVTVLVNRKLTEELRHQITFMLDQFKPIRTKIRLLQMEHEAVMDGNSYLDMNATIPESKHVVLDEEAMYDGTITLL